MAFNATFNNISILLVEETGVPAVNHGPVTSRLQINVLSSIEIEILYLIFYLPWSPASLLVNHYHNSSI
jgi:hypothetical protein